MTKIRITSSSGKRGWRWTYLSWHVHKRRSWLSECQPRKLITSRKQAGLAFEPSCCSSLACSSGLRWGRTLGTELPHLLVRSHMKSYMWCLIGGPCSHHCSHCHQSWPLDWEVTKGHWEMLSCTVGFTSCRLQSVNGLVLVKASTLFNGMNLLSCEPFLLPPPATLWSKKKYFYLH